MANDLQRFETNVGVLRKLYTSDGRKPWRCESIKPQEPQGCDAVALAVQFKEAQHAGTDSIAERHRSRRGPAVLGERGAAQWALQPVERPSRQRPRAPRRRRPRSARARGAVGASP